MENNKEKREEFFFNSWYWKYKFKDSCSPVNAIVPFLKKEGKFLIINCTEKDVFSSVLKKEGFKVDTIYFEEESDFINYPNEKLEAYDYVFFFPFNFRVTYVMEKLFSTKVPFAMLDIVKESLFANNKRLGMINNNKCELMFFYYISLVDKADGGAREYSESTGLVFLCRDVLTDKIMSAKIYEDSVELVIPV
jgi:hypothetical protein|nr:MAG TPA: hypothetical protein [Caudoviricetes sp.]